MKKLWIVLLSMAMVAAFCMPASAVDVKFSGSYYVAGDYYSDLFVDDDDDQSTAFFRQRLRVQTEFVVAPGLSLITRFDALEKIWGDSNWSGTESNAASRPHTAANAYSSGSKIKEQENIEFEQAYIQYMSKVGLWWIGYAPHDFWGTAFGDSNQTQALVQWILPLSQNWIIGAKYFKTYEGSSSLYNGDDRGNDSDDNAYVAVGIYKTQATESGLKIAYRRFANWRDGEQDQYPTGPGSVSLPDDGVIKGWLLTPYFTGQFGPVKVQAELEYWNGEIEYEDGVAREDADMEMLAAYVDAKVDIGPAYVGARFVYASGNDWEETILEDGDISGSDFNSRWEANWGGKDLNQTLILWNDDVTNWLDSSWTDMGPGVKNALFYQIYGGYKWGDFDFFASFAYAEADEAWIVAGPATVYENKDDDYGYELDVTATYSITDNLKYMVGFGYLWTGDYFKYQAKGQADNGADVDDVYLLTNKLTLTF